jgi:hypothetical protein
VRRYFSAPEDRHVEEIGEPGGIERTRARHWPIGSGRAIEAASLFAPFNRGLARLGQYPRYSITSSARASNVGGTSRPSALAVLRLMTKLILGRRLHRKVGRLLALEDAIDIACGKSVLADGIGPVGKAFGRSLCAAILRRKADDEIRLGSASARPGDATPPLRRKTARRRRRSRNSADRRPPPCPRGTQARAGAPRGHRTGEWR